MSIATASGETPRAVKPKTAMAPTPPNAQFAKRPIQVFPGFQGSTGPPKAVPKTEAAGSPKAIIAQTAAAIGRNCPRQIRIRTSTIAGYATIPASRCPDVAR